MSLEYRPEGEPELTIAGKPQRLAVLDGGTDQLFLIFADATSGTETYGGGQYLYLPRPDESGMTVVDFNRAYNPPCVFTQYATCLLPPSQNRMEVAVRAGERAYEAK